MANLARMIMEGGSIGSSANLTHSYDHEDGAGLIAMESAVALRDIYEAQFYIPNTCEIEAAFEGASCVEESSYASIMEGAFKNAIERIKEFFVKLKDKVLEFLHNIKRFLSGVFQSAEKWVKTYEKELNNIKNDLKDYEIQGFKYDIKIKKVMDKGVIGYDKIIQMAEYKVNSVLKTDASTSDKKISKLDEKNSEDDLVEEYKKVYTTYVKNLIGKSDIDDDEIDETIWKLMRSGASSKNDTERISVSSIFSTAIDALKNSVKEVDEFDDVIKNTRTQYDDALKFLNKTESKFKDISDEGGKVTNPKSGKEQSWSSTKASYISKQLSAFSSITSKMQTLANKYTSAAKVALQERNRMYYSALKGAFAYARKNTKGGK